MVFFLRYQWVLVEVKLNSVSKKIKKIARRICIHKFASPFKQCSIYLGFYSFVQFIFNFFQYFRLFKQGFIAAVF